MQCGCPSCGILMTQVVKGLESTCRCSDCGFECKACLGGQKGANIIFEKGMSKEDWERIIATRRRDVDD